jgi:hypothetical protein
VVGCMRETGALVAAGLWARFSWRRSGLSVGQNFHLSVAKNRN